MKVNWRLVRRIAFQVIGFIVLTVAAREIGGLMISHMVQADGFTRRAIEIVHELTTPDGKQVMRVVAIGVLSMMVVPALFAIWWYGQFMEWIGKGGLEKIGLFKRRKGQEVTS